VSAGPRRRELGARGLGIAVALAAMATATSMIEWPAPGASAALGITVYMLARGRPQGARVGQREHRWLG
jgi:hypothetical protein